MSRFAQCTCRMSEAGEAVADAWYGEDVARVGGVRLDLATQAADVDPDELDLLAVGGTPDTLQQHLMREHHAGVLGEHTQQLKFGLAERDGLAGDADDALGKVYGELAALEDWLLRGRVSACLACAQD